MGAEVKSFQQLTFGTNIFSYYSRDKTRVYYKNIPLLNAGVHSISYAGINNAKNQAYVNNYIKDKQSVYYQASQLEHVNATSFIAEKLGQTLTHATDGKKYFINGIPFPETVNNKFYGSIKPNLDEIILLQKKSGSHFHVIFSDATAIYYFDEQKQRYIHAKNIKQKRPFQYVDNGVFSDGEFIYFTAYEKISSFRSGMGVSGHISYVFKSQLKSKNFLKLKEIEGATIYQHEQDFYIAINELPSVRVNASLVKLINLDVMNGVIRREHLEKINDVSSVVKFKTRF